MSITFTKEEIIGYLKKFCDKRKSKLNFSKFIEDFDHYLDIDVYSDIENGHREFKKYACPYIFIKGKNKGTKCGVTSENGFCKKHAPTINKKDVVVYKTPELVSDIESEISVNVNVNKDGNISDISSVVSDFEDKINLDENYNWKLEDPYEDDGDLDNVEYDGYQERDEVDEIDFGE